MVDLGDSLLSPYTSLPEPGPGARNTAEAMMRALGLIGVDALVPGESELALGTRWLATRSAADGVPLLAANLKSKERKDPFQPVKLVETGGVKVGLIGLMEPAQGPKDLALAPRRARVGVRKAETVLPRQIKALQRQGAELIVLLAHMELPRAEALAATLEGVHLVVVGHSGARMAEPKKLGQTLLVEGGRRGRELGHLRIALGEGWAPDATLTDDSRRFGLYERARRELSGLTALREKGSEQERDMREEVLFKRVEQLKGQLAELKQPEGEHLVGHDLVPLDKTVPDHPAVKALLDSAREEAARLEREHPQKVPAGVAITPLPAQRLKKKSAPR